MVEDVFGGVDIDVADLVPRDLQVPNATSQRCRSDWDLAFKQKNCSPGIIKSKRNGSCGLATNITTIQFESISSFLTFQFTSKN